MNWEIRPLIKYQQQHQLVTWGEWNIGGIIIIPVCMLSYFIQSTIAQKGSGSSQLISIWWNTDFFPSIGFSGSWICLVGLTVIVFGSRLCSSVSLIRGMFLSLGGVGTFWLWMAFLKFAYSHSCFHMMSYCSVVFYFHNVSHCFFRVPIKLQLDWNVCLTMQQTWW